MIAWLESGDAGPDRVDDADTLVTEDPAGRACRHIAL